MIDPDDELPLDEAQRLDQLADEFEEAFRAGRSPRVAEFLQRCRLPRKPVLRELISLDYELRQQAGQVIGLTEYLEQFPDDQSTVLAALNQFGMNQAGDAALLRAGTVTEPAEEGDESWLPKRIGRYEIRRGLGSGGFGVVYLAYDTQLDRLVAIKLPQRATLASDEQIANFLREASVAANLKHPCIVSVFDVQFEQRHPYIVYEYVQGENLASWAARQQLPFQQIVKLLIQIAEALRHAHQNGVVHCDLKLANILIDQQANPRIADFGLAIRDQFATPDHQVSGTPISMAPEQISGEQKLIDARTDIWAMGVMFYELLLGRRPFYGQDYKELYDRIQHAEPDAPVQVDPSIPGELSRICLKCLAKNRDDRYHSAAGLLSDLEAWLKQARRGQVPQYTWEGATGRSHNPFAITPRGLRAFGANDQSFYPSLLPGPRDASGLPEAISFWKRKLESRSPDDALRVGLIYGPSGSGKSSLVRAGVIPSLDTSRLTIVSLDASPEGTEAALMQRLIACFPEQTLQYSLPQYGSLPQFVANLREIGAARKIIIILDQFEQWLQVERDYDQAELVQMLRQCNGVDVQAVLVVRDDFFASVNLLFNALQLPLHEGQNYALVPRFSVQHAEFVLTQFGRAYGAIPAETPAQSDTLMLHQEFVSQAVAQLAGGGSVVSVRLALFAEMMKQRPWVPSTLIDFGGTEGLGAAYLEDSISGPSAGPIARSHEVMIRRVLRELLPPPNRDIRGAVRSEGWLRTAAGCDSSADWQAVVGVLDRDLRLITPVDPWREASNLHQPNTECSYQLTHDYLVPLLRTWLTRKQRETRRGRAEIKLSELAQMWSSQPSSRFLPGIFEWAEFHLFTSRKHWNAAEKSIMQRANRRSGLLLTAALGFVCCAALLVGVFLRQREATMRQLVSLVQKTELGDIPELISKLDVSPTQLRSTLSQMAIDSPTESIRIDLALLRYEPHRLENIQSQLLELEPDEVASLRPALATHGRELSDYLWKVAEQQGADVSTATASRRLLTATSFLAEYADAADARWISLKPAIVGSLLNLAVENNRKWAMLHRPVAGHLRPDLDRIRREETLERLPNELQRPYTEHQIDLIVDMQTDLAGEDINLLGEILFTGLPEHFDRVFSKFAVQRERALDLAKNELGKEATFIWQDANWPTTSPVPDALRSELRAAFGLLTDKFACCQTLPWQQFEELAKKLTGYGYRPIRIRPYPAEGQLLTAAIWIRDGKRSHFDLSLTKSEVKSINFDETDDGLVPIDLAGYVESHDGQAEDRFVLVLAEADAELSDFRVYAGVEEQEQYRTEFKLANGQYRIASSLQCYEGVNGMRRYCGVIAKDQDESSTTFKCQSQRDFENYEDWDRILTDICLCPVAEPQTANSYFDRVIHDWTLDSTRQDWTNSHNRSLLLAEAYFQTQDYHRALQECDRVIREFPQVALPYRMRSRMRAMNAAKLPNAEAAASARAEIADDLSKFARLCWNPAEALAARAVAFAYLGEAQSYLSELEAMAISDPDNVELQIIAAEAFAGCSFVMVTNKGRADSQWSDQAIAFLRAAQKAGWHDWMSLYRNADWSHLLDRTDFQQLRVGEPVQVYYAGSRCTSRKMDATEVHGLDLPEHLERCEQLAAEGFRPVSISVASIEGNALCASVWQRPMITQDALEEIAIRRANAGIAAFRLGSHQVLWLLLDRQPDPRLRTRAIHTIAPSQCDPRPFVGRLFEELNDAQKFSLVQILGEVNLDQQQRDRVSQKVIEWFEFELDSGVHSACEWLLRKWGYTQAIDEIHQRLSTGRREAGRRWYRDKLNLFTFACIDGPVEFMRGMPRNAQALERMSGETLVRSRIARSYAIATTEVTWENLQALHKATSLTKPIDEARIEGPTSAAGGVNWKIAGLYCQYLDDKQRTPGKEWCFEYIGDDSEPIRLAANYLSRTGYRLPTLSEWEYAARAGTVTKRHFGENTAFLDEYVWYGYNSNYRLQPVGLKKPNDYGLFDTLGNADEWLMERDSRVYGIGPIGDIEDILPIAPHVPRLFCGSNYASIPSAVRLARNAYEVPYRNGSNLGIRLARTLPPSEQ